MTTKVASAPKLTVLDVIGNGGLFAKALPGYEARTQQVESAELIQTGIQTRKHVALELGTGGGKSFAALVPAVLAALNSGQKVVYATYMRSLQGQIAQKDAPMLVEILSAVADRPITYAVLKGRGNYVCLKNVDQLETSGEFRSAQAAGAFPAFAEWVGQQRIEGGLADLEDVPQQIPNDLRLDSVTSTEECTGQRCKFYDECFAERAKNRAKNADIVIANTKLVCLDASIRESSDGMAVAVPDHDILIVDEAHNLEDVIRDTAGFEVTPGRLNRLGWLLQKYTIGHPTIAEYRDDTAEKVAAQKWADDQDQILLAIHSYLDGLKATLEKDEDRREMRLGDEREVRLGAQPLPGMDDDRPTISQAASVLSAFGRRMENAIPSWLEGDDRDSWMKLADQTVTLGSEILEVISPDGDGTWVRRAALDGEAGKTRVVLDAKPIDVAPIGRRWFFGGIEKVQMQRQAGGGISPAGFREPLVVISMSATIATNGNLNMYRQRVGCDDALTLVNGSSFNYRENALLYLPGNPHDLVPAQRRDREGYERYMTNLAAHMRGLTLDARGGAFLLFTSRSAMNEVYSRIADDLRDAGLLVMKQGDAGLRQMIDAFKADGNAVLFGLKTFGEGVDVQGDALRLVAIDKVPFNPPTDVVWDALCKHIERNGGNSFRDLSLPSAIIVLKQFVGRLIRSKTDRGVMAILDGRLGLKFYGREIIGNMPPARTTSAADDVAALYAAMRSGRPAAPVPSRPRPAAPSQAPAPVMEVREVQVEVKAPQRFRRLGAGESATRFRRLGSGR